MNTVQKERFALDGGYMARIIDVDALLTKMGPLLCERAGQVGVATSALNILDRLVDLRTGTVVRSSGPNDVVFDRADTAVQLLLGVIAPQDVVGVHWNQHKPWIPFLFPETYFHTSSWDEF